MNRNWFRWFFFWLKICICLFLEFSIDILLVFFDIVIVNGKKLGILILYLLICFMIFLLLRFLWRLVNECFLLLRFFLMFIFLIIFFIGFWENLYCVKFSLKLWKYFCFVERIWMLVILVSFFKCCICFM